MALSVFHVKRTRFFWLLVGAVIALNLLVISIVAVALHQSQTQYHQQAMVDSQNLAHVLAQDIQGSLLKIDLALLDAADEYSRQLASGYIDARELNEHLILQSTRLPEIYGLRIAGANGYIEYGTSLPAGSKISIKDRDHFQFPRDNPDLGLFVSKPIMGRISGSWIVILARRISHRDGSFAGVVFAPIELQQFINSFSAINVGSRGFITLFDRQFGIIARHPEPQGLGSSVGVKITTPQFQAMLQAGKESGSYQAKSVVDHIERSVSFRKIPDQPLYIFVGLAFDDYLGEWRKMATNAAILLAFFLLSTLTASWLACRGWRRRLLVEEALNESDARLKAAQQLAQLGSWELNLSTHALTWSDEIFHIFEIDKAKFGASYEAFLNAIHPEDRELVNTAYSESVRNRSAYDIEHRLLLPDGRIKYVTERGETSYNLDGKPVRSMGTVQDITAQKEYEMRIQHMAHFDSLTDLPNRELFYDRLHQVIAQARRDGRTCALIFLDLDRFKAVNDTLGHHVGDMLLQAVAVRLKSSVRETDTVSRFAGDEFTVLLPYLNEKNGAEVVAAKITAALAQPFMLDGHEVHVGSSAGIAFYPGDADNDEALIKCADTAMYEAKKQGRGMYCLYQPSRRRDATAE